MRSQRLLRRRVVEARHEAAVELRLERGEHRVLVRGEVAPLRYISSDDPVRLFNGALLPAVVRVAEVDRHAEEPLERPVHGEQYVVVERHRAHLGEASLDAHEGGVHLIDGDLDDALEEGDAEPPVDDDQEDALPVLPRDDEVAFAIADTRPFLNAFRPLVYEFPVP